MTVFISYMHSYQIISLLSKPILRFLIDDSSDFIFVSVIEVFNTCLFVAFYTSVFLYNPIFFYLIFDFIKPGLFKYEKIFFSYIFRVFVQLILLLCIFAYYIIIPSILSFFLTLDIIVDSEFVVVKMQTKIYDYVIFIYWFVGLYSLTLCKFFLMSVCFAYFDFLNPLFLLKKRKFAIIGSLFLGCLFSSPDLISLFLVSFPLIFFFEINLFVSILKYKYLKIIYTGELLERKKASLLNLDPLFKLVEQVQLLYSLA